MRSLGTREIHRTRHHLLPRLTSSHLHLLIPDFQRDLSSKVSVEAWRLKEMNRIESIYTAIAELQR